MNAKQQARFEAQKQECDMWISIWSMRPQPGTPTGEAWEAGARRGWQESSMRHSSSQSELIAALVGALKRCEYIEPERGFVRYCPCCNVASGDHHEKCEVAIALALARGLGVE